MTSPSGDDLAQLLANEQSKERKLQIIFGIWWRHYAVPYEFPLTLYRSHPECPYCLGPLGPLTITSEGADPDSPADLKSAHLDHMDPLSRGGEDSIRNALYVCSDCNLAKGRLVFADWLARLTPALQHHARKLYEDKHGHTVEAFVPGRKQPRLTLPRRELTFDEPVLLKLFPKPIVSRPPRRE